MSKTNCVNCGAAKDTSEIRCPFCGTTYLDFTAIDFTKHDPVVCEFVMPWTQKKTVMRMLALPMMDRFSMESPNALDITSLCDFRHRYISAQPEINVEISFKPIMQKDGSIMTFRNLREDE